MISHYLHLKKYRVFSNTRAWVSLMLILLALIFITLSGCKQVTKLIEIDQVIYSYNTGPILPEMQVHEQYSILKDRVEFSRNGLSNDSMVNSGTWLIQVDEQKSQELFNTLKSVKCKSIQRIEPADPPDGGYTLSYEISYSDGTSCNLIYNPGVEYSGGEVVVDPVTAYISALVLPSDSVNRYK